MNKKNPTSVFPLKGVRTFVSLTRVKHRFMLRFVVCVLISKYNPYTK